jgi:L-glutamine-phosphate cytidylyltransferase
MKALILAAGQGTRIRSAHGERPKCLIPFNDSDWTILDQQIYSLSAAGLREIGIVVGYEKQQIIRHITENYWGSLRRFRFIENSRFRETNNIYSLWLAQDWLKNSSFVALNADVAFDPAVLPAALASPAPITMIVDPLWRDETMKVVIEGDRILRMSKQITRDEFSATYIGVTVFGRSITSRFFDKLDRLISEGRSQVFFNVGVQELIEDGVRVGYTQTLGHAWAEIDDPGDLAFARSSVFPELVLADTAA